MAPPIDHVIVLALENRSFDHMLGFLPHESPAYDGLAGAGLSNPDWPGTGTVEATDGAKTVLPYDADHTHDAVMEQLDVRGLGKNRAPTNQGFVKSYERKGRGLNPPVYAGLLGPLINWVTGRFGGDPKVTGRGPLIMLCQPAAQVPVLSTLALEFAVCTRWFCSVPGETWPNRNFMHAATSDGETDISIRPFFNETIFERLEEQGRDWHVYHDDTPQLWAFPKLWDTPGRHAHWYRCGEFAEHVRNGRLPAYSFIEPNHRLPGIDDPDHSNSQHPGNNRCRNAAYDSAPATQEGDFVRGEALIAGIYETLRANPAVFERSLLLITYDEHGGFYDHVPPPTGVPAPTGSPGRLARLLRGALRVLWRRKSKAFDFTMLGPRVPAVVVSPYIERHTVDATPRDHAAVPATLRKIFLPGGEPLTERDRWSPPFDGVLTRTEPRRADLPDLAEYARPAPTTPPAAQEPIVEIPEYYTAFADQAAEVREHLAEIREPEVLVLPPTPPAQQPAQTTEAFTAAAERHREEGSSPIP